ncbi:MAG TPA: YfhO family protein [Planctomycetota bacterium]|nr:YfhO family protein [Planctomycetota bacterium]
MRRALPFLLYGAVTLACFHKFIFFGWTLYDVRVLEAHLGLPAPEKTGWFESHRPPADRGDTVLSLPLLHRLYGEGLHHGELRLWNPYLFCGYPIYNNLLLHPFYPPNLVLHALLPPRTASDLNLLIHFFFSGASMYALLRGSSRGHVAATVGGLLWMLIGYNTFWFSTGTFMGASVFAPLALLGLRRGLETRSLKPLALGGLAMGMVILGSHGQHALHLLIVLSLWLLVSGVADRDSRWFAAKGGGLFIGCALGSGMAAILTQLDSVTHGFRVPGDDLRLHYADPWVLPTYIANVALGKICYAPDGLLRSEFTIYAGVAGTALALAGAIRGFGQRWIRFLTILAAVTLLVAFVKPLAQTVLAIPFLNLSMPARWVYVFGFCLTMLAAAGVDALADDRVRTSRILVAVVGLCLVSIPFYARRGAPVETLIGAGLAVGWLASAWRAPRVAPLLAVAAISFELIPNFVCFNVHADPAVFDRTFPVIEEMRAREKEPWRATGILRVAGADRGAYNPWASAVGSNILALYGVEAVMGYESIAPLSTVVYCTRMNGDIYGSGRVLELRDPGDPLTAFGNLNYVVSPFPFGPEASALQAIGSWPPLTLYLRSSRLPRAYLADRAVQADLDSTAGILTAKDFDPATSVVLESGPLPRTSPGGGTVRWVVRTSDRLELAVASKGDSILVVSDTDYPGWEASVDGVETPILRANLTFRAVAVPAGPHTVIMRFRPPSARHGLILSALTLVAVLGACAWRKTI